MSGAVRQEARAGTISGAHPSARNATLHGVRVSVCIRRLTMRLEMRRSHSPRISGEIGPRNAVEMR